MILPTKIEYHAVTKGGYTVFLADSLEEAIAVPGCHTVVRVTRYLDRRETVWKKDEKVAKVSDALAFVRAKLANEVSVFVSCNDRFPQVVLHLERDSTLVALDKAMALVLADDLRKKAETIK